MMNRDVGEPHEWLERICRHVCYPLFWSVYGLDLAVPKNVFS